MQSSLSRPLGSDTDSGGGGGACDSPSLSQWDRRISELKQKTYSLCLRGVAEFYSPSPSSRAVQRPVDPALVRDAFHSSRFGLADTLCFYFRTGGDFKTPELFISTLESQNIFVNAGFVQSKVPKEHFFYGIMNLGEYIEFFLLFTCFLMCLKLMKRSILIEVCFSGQS